MGVVITIIFIIVLFVGCAKISKKHQKMHEEEIREVNTESSSKQIANSRDEIKCNGLTVREKESSDRFRKGLLILNEIAVTGNSTMLKPEEVAKKIISLATDFPEIIYGHACDRLKKYNSISSQDRTWLMYSYRDIIGEDMEQNIMNARNEKQIDEYFEELIASMVKMIRKL